MRFVRDNASGDGAGEDALKLRIRRTLQHISQRIADIVGDLLVIVSFGFLGDGFDFAS